MLEECCKAYSVIGKIWFLSNHCYSIFFCLGIVFEQLFSALLSDHICVSVLVYVDLHKSNAHHAQSNDHNAFLCRYSHIGNLVSIITNVLRKQKKPAKTELPGLSWL